MKKRMAFFILPILFLSLGLALGAARDKDTLVIAQGVDATSLDSMGYVDTPSFNVRLNVYDTLLQRDMNLKIEPLLAESYRLIDDLTWEFKLRKGVKFHNGEDFNASVVKFNLERLADPRNKLPQTFLIGVLDRVDILDEYTVRIITKKPLPTLDSRFCLFGGMIAPKYLQEKGPGYLATHPVGTGPYKFVRWVKDDEIVLEAFDQYWRGTPKIKRVVFKPIPEATTRVASLQTGETDIIVNIPPHLMKLADWKGRSFVSRVPSVRVIYMGFNTLKPGPVADKRVRRAISHAVNMDAIIKEVLGGHGILLGSLLTKDHFGYDPAVKPYPYDPEKAKRLLAEAGYNNGFDFVLNSPADRYLKDKEVAEAVVGYLRKTGINASVRFHEWGNYLKQIIMGHKADPAYLLGWGDTTYDADFTLFPLLRSGRPISTYSNPRVDTLIDQGQTTMDKKKRQKIYSDALKIIHEDVPFAWCYQQVDIYGVNERVNWKARPDERLVVFDMSFKK
jgi:peptide/nickel transport system substrate-binding protein